MDPNLLNKLHLESLIAAGCFDGIEANRAGVHMLAEAILGTAQAAAAARESAQTALFGESTDQGLAMLVPNASWTLAETMAQEKEAFGFYFSGHPVEAWRPVLDAQGALSFAEVAALPAPAGGGKKGVVMAGLIEEIRWRTPQNGGSGRGSNRYMLITLSDRSGQYVASCFDEDAQNRLEAVAGDSPSVLVQAELMWREGEDVPRVTLRGITLLAEMAKRARGRLVVTIADAADVPQLAALVAGARGKGRGELVAEVATAAGLARVWLGRDYLLDAELMAQVARAFGAERVASEILDPPRLSLVG